MVVERLCPRISTLAIGARQDQSNDTAVLQCSVRRGGPFSSLASW